MQRHVYAVVSLSTGQDKPIIVRVSASSEGEATEEVKSQLEGNITILSVRKIKTLEENCLDILWQAYPDLYLEIWEPDITTSEMLERLKERSPALYEGFMEW